MPRNVSGVYSLPAGLPTNGETSNATDDIRTPFGDLETDMNTARPIVAGGTGATSASGARTNLGLGSMATQAASGVAITGGAIDGTALGGTTPAAGAFTTLSATGATSVAALEASGVLSVASEIQHVGDTDNKIAFGTDTQSFETGGSSRLDLSDSGMRLGGANARVTTILDEDDMASNSDEALATQQSFKAYVDNLFSLISSPTTQGPTTASGTAVDFTSIAAGKYRISIMAEGVSLDGSTDDLAVQLSTGSTFKTTGYVSSSTNNEVTSGFGVRLSSAAREWDGMMIIERVPGTNRWTAIHSGRVSAGTTVHGGGQVDLGGELDGIRVTRSGSTDSFDAGTLSIRME